LKLIVVAARRNLNSLQLLPEGIKTLCSCYQEELEHIEVAAARNLNCLWLMSEEFCQKDFKSL
jgi:hypothetical protein